jgi:predicted Ser/Thr protein kinase
MLVAEDAIGPPTRWLAIDFEDGSNEVLDTPREIGRFLRQLETEAPELARRIKDELLAKERPANYQAVLYDRRDDNSR